MTAHSPFGASGIHRVIAGCYGSMEMQSKFEDSSSLAAKTGTAAHELGERCLNDLSLNPWSFKGQVIEVDGEQISVDEVMCEGVDLYLAIVNEYADFGLLRVEVRFHLSHLHDMMWGTADAVVYLIENDGVIVHIFDYKNGFQPVEVENNSQLMYYALGAVYKEKGPIKAIHLHIVQPNALHQAGPHREVELTLEELNEWRDKTLMPAIRSAQEPNAALKAGDHCLFCKAEGACPELDKQVTKELQNEFSVITTGNPDPVAVTEMLSTSRLEEICLAGPMIKNFIERAGARLQERLEGGENSDHFMLVPKRSNRKWLHEQLVLNTLNGVVELYASPKLKSPAQMESAYSAVLKAQGIKKHKKEAADFIESLWEKPDAGNTMSQRTSARLEAGPSVVSDFMDDDEMFQ
ncbi:DUF2800 domain-containing protein [Candidatus Pacearchaeota archaeon]|nr:DUF2800 domain-containing protein [Candidatus Pacearchaeota archaeon]